MSGHSEAALPPERVLSGAEPGDATPDPEEPLDRLLRHLRTTRAGLGQMEAERRLVQFGPNRIERRGGRRWPRELGRQFTHPLALLLWAAAGLAWAADIVPVAIAVVIVIVLNATFAFAQEAQAERAVEALAGYLPSEAKVARDGHLHVVDAAALVPGDVVSIEEGDRIPADMRLLTGALEIDMSTLTGESVPVTRSDAPDGSSVPLLQANDVVFSGTTCTEGEATGVVFATGMHTEIGRIAALSARVGGDESPLDTQVRRVAMLIALIAVVMGLIFVPVATLGAGLSLSNAVVFAIGLLVGNVPEGLLPVITLALAVGARELARNGAVIKRLSAIETLGSTNVICTDKTGTLTENRMRVTTLWTPGGERRIGTGPPRITVEPETEHLARVIATCTNARIEPDGERIGDPTELALLDLAQLLDVDTGSATRTRDRRGQFHFDPGLKLMSTIDERDGGIWVTTKGAPEAVIPRCSAIRGAGGWSRPLASEPPTSVEDVVDRYAGQGLRVLAVAERQIPAGEAIPTLRDQAEADLCLLGLVAMADPPRAEVAAAVRDCRQAGVRVIIVTGDHARTAAAIGRETGITGSDPTIVTGRDVEAMTDRELGQVLDRGGDLIFARSAPEDKLRIADALRAQDQVVAMTGDGVNDAPALRRADIGIAMGRSGTDVAREASTMVLTDDNFATIVRAVEAGRRVFDNLRKFMLYIFAHTTPEVTPFVVFALGGGAIPLPLTVLQLLAFDVGTETLPALALGQEPAEPGLMQRPPRPRREGIIRRSMLIRAWLFLGAICAALQMIGFFVVLHRAGWTPGAATGPGTPLHHAYQQATTMTFLGMVAGQIGTAFAARTERASLRSVGVFTNRMLIWGIAFELLLTAALIYLPPLQAVLGTASLPLDDIALVLPFPFIVWGADEARKWIQRRRIGTA